MGGVVKGLDKVMQSMDLQKVMTIHYGSTSFLYNCRFQYYTRDFP